MKIRMYDCRFGDCFLLSEDKDIPLMVDCGIHSKSKEINPELQYDEIYKDIQHQTVDFF